MKRLFFTLLVILTTSYAIAQDEVIAEREKQTRELMKGDLRDESDRSVLREKLDEAKMDLRRIDDKLDLVKGYQDGLELYKTQAQELRYDLLVKQLKLIREAIRTHDKGKLILEENRLRKRLKGMLATLDKGSDAEGGAPSGIQSPEFIARISEIMKGFRENATIQHFMENKDPQPYITDTLTLDSLGAIFNRDNAAELWADIDTEIKKEAERLAETLMTLHRQRDSLKEIKRKITEKLDEDTNINGMAIVLGLPLFCFTILFLFLGPGYIQARQKTGDENKLLAKSQDVLLDLSTVLLLTMSILILGLSGNINNEVLGTLVGGISGYVLNKTRNN